MPLPGHFAPEEDPERIVKEAGWALGPVWTGVDNLAPTPTGIRSTDRPPRSESLYRLSYAGPQKVIWTEHLLKMRDTHVSGRVRECRETYRRNAGRQRERWINKHQERQTVWNGFIHSFWRHWRLEANLISLLIESVVSQTAKVYVKSG